MNKNLTRRKMLKTSTAALGAVAGAGLLKGFPAIHAADAPVIRYLGTAVNMGDAVQKKLFDDRLLCFHCLTLNVLIAHHRSL